MEIRFDTKLQAHIADLLWKADGFDQVKSILSVYGKEAEVVYHMILATYFDESMEIDMAEPVINAIRSM